MPYLVLEPLPDARQGDSLDLPEQEAKKYRGKLRRTAQRRAKERR